MSNYFIKHKEDFKMRLNKCLITAILILLSSGFVGVAHGHTLTFASDTTWNVFDASNNPIGFAQQVCLHAGDPVNCPPGATMYNYAGPGSYSADLSSIPGATWIWAPGITGDTPSASLAQYSFVKTFNVAGPLLGYLSIAADDYATIYVNNIQVGTVGSITNINHAANVNLHSFDISTYLQSGLNVIEISVQNGPDFFSGYQNANYSQNPAGVVFGGVFGKHLKVAEPSTFALFTLATMGFVGYFKIRKRS
jgi:hypothetical protein